VLDVSGAVSSAISITMKPAQLCRAFPTTFKDQPAEVLRAAPRLLSGRYNVAWRHRRARRQRPHATERQAVDPILALGAIRGIQTGGREDDCDLEGGDLQGVKDELIGDRERRIAGDVVPPPRRGKEVLDYAVGIPAVDEVMPRRLKSGPPGGLDYRPETAARIVDVAVEFLRLEQPLAAPRRLDVVVVRLAVPDVGVTLAGRGGEGGGGAGDFGRCSAQYQVPSFPFRMETP
jgi:hypothetical protein